MKKMTYLQELEIRYIHLCGLVHFMLLSSLCILEFLPTKYLLAIQIGWLASIKMMIDQTYTWQSMYSIWRWSPFMNFFLVIYFYWQNGSFQYTGWKQKTITKNLWVSFWLFAISKRNDTLYVNLHKTLVADHICVFSLTSFNCIKWLGEIFSQP